MKKVDLEVALVHVALDFTKVTVIDQEIMINEKQLQLLASASRIAELEEKLRVNAVEFSKMKVFMTRLETETRMTYEE
ncbi:hypothetical protein ACFX13_041806 [Malus domestica]